MAFTDESLARRIIRFVAMTAVYGAGLLFAGIFGIVLVALWIYEWSVLFQPSKETVDARKDAAFWRWAGKRPRGFWSVPKVKRPGSVPTFSEQDQALKPIRPEGASP